MTDPRKIVELHEVEEGYFRGITGDLASNNEELKAENHRLAEENETLTDALQQIRTWANAYPLAIFPEPDFVKAAAVLKDNGMTLDAISASNMRRVLDGVMRIVDATLKEAPMNDGAIGGG